MPTSLSRIAYDHIRNRLNRGALGSGSELSEPALAKELGISRTPVREAIRQLASEGLLEQRPKRGTFVRRPSRRDLEEIYQVRLLLEPFAAREAAKKIDAGGLRELRKLLAGMLRLTRQCRTVADEPGRDRLLRDYAALDLDFHLGLLRAADNHRIFKVVADARILTQALAFPKDSPKGTLVSMTRGHREHMRIYRAVARRDARAAHGAMAFHLSRGRTSVLEYFDWLEMQSTRDQ